MDELDILPSQASPLEQALDANACRVLAIDGEIAARIKDPDHAPVEFLPFLAWERGVDLWFDDWPVWKKRRMIKDSYRLKGLKGTLSGLKAYLEYVDAKIIDYIVPPQDIFARRSDPAVSRRFKSQFAELRLYPAQRLRTPIKPVVGQMFAYSTSHWPRRAVISDKTRETPLSYLGGGLFTRIWQAPSGSKTIGKMIAKSGLPNALINVNDPGQVLNIEPETVSEQRKKAGAVAIIGGSFIGRMAVGKDLGETFKRWRLFDPARSLAARIKPGGSIIGRMIVGLTPFTAFLRIDAKFEARDASAVIGHTVVGKIMARSNPTGTERIVRAIVCAKALRDIIYFTTRTYRPMLIADLTFDQPQPFGGMVAITRRYAT